MTSMKSMDRRAFFGQLAAFSTAVPFAGTAEPAPSDASDGSEPGPLTPAQRRRMALEVRIEAAVCGRVEASGPI